MIASRQTIAKWKPVDPFVDRTSCYGMTCGLGPAGYDIRVLENLELAPGTFSLASSVERFTMPPILLGIVHDKSTWARQGLCVQNTVIEPGWCGYLTLELTNHGHQSLQLISGMPIAQVIFHLLDEPTTQPYRGRYFMQKSGAQPAIFDSSAPQPSAPAEGEERRGHDGG